MEYNDTGLPYGAVAYQVDIHFDPSCVNITDKDFSTSPFNVNAFTPYAPGVVRIGGNNYGLGAISSGTYKMATLTLHGKCECSDCASDIWFDTNLVSDTDGNAITNSYTNGTFTAPTVHNLNTGEYFSTIQAAINAVNTTDGHIIIIDPGTYNENMDVYKSLTIKSTSGPEDTIILASNPNDHVFEVTADYVNITGFTVTGAGDEKAGIPLYSADHCVISNNNIQNNINHPEHTSQAWDNGYNQL